MEIQIAGLTKVFPPNVEAITNLYLTIPENDFVYLVGKTGSGKTTLLRMLTCEVAPTQGRLTVGGVNLRELSRSEIPFFRRDVGVVFQDFKLLPHLSAWENVAFPLEVCGYSKADVEERVDEVINQIGLWHRRFLLPEQLSGGECQRVAIARAVANMPALFLADEPTGNLDPHTAEYVLQMLLSIHSAGTTVVVATHDQLLVNSYRQRVVELQQGRLKRDERQGSYSDGDL